jgi:hypothetical protein
MVKLFRPVPRIQDTTVSSMAMAEEARVKAIIVLDVRNTFLWSFFGLWLFSEWT